MFKKVLLFILLLFSFSNAFAASEPDVPILLYHNIAESYEAGDNLLHITPERFKEHMQALNNAGYTAISYNDYKNYVNGTILDISAKGGTVFIEPDNISKFSTQLISLKSEEAIEEYKILSYLTELIFENINEIKN